MKITFQYKSVVSLLIAIISCVMTQNLSSQDIPLGYIEQYSQTYSTSKSIRTLNLEKPEYWKMTALKNGKALAIDPSDSILSSSLPGARGIISNMIFGDFIITFDYMNQPADSNYTGFSFLGPVKSPENYYTFLFSKDTIFFVYINHNKQYIIGKQYTPSLKTDWNGVKIVRNILTREIQIEVNKDIANPIVFSDRNLVMGYIGFGSNHSPSYLRNITIWAPTSITDSTFTWSKTTN